MLQDFEKRFSEQRWQRPTLDGVSFKQNLEHANNMLLGDLRRLR